jgi:hypothetical protein
MIIDKNAVDLPPGRPVPRWAPDFAFEFAASVAVLSFEVYSLSVVFFEVSVAVLSSNSDSEAPFLVVVACQGLDSSPSTAHYSASVDREIMYTRKTVLPPK